MRLGEKVMRLLEQSGRSQKELSKAINAPPPTISGWRQQNRNPTSDYVIPICKFFGITPNELFEYGNAAEGIDEEELELLAIFRRLDRKGKRAVLHEADVQDDRVGVLGDNAFTRKKA